MAISFYTANQGFPVNFKSDQRGLKPDFRGLKPDFRCLKPDFRGLQSQTSGAQSQILSIQGLTLETFSHTQVSLNLVPFGAPSSFFQIQVWP